MIVAVVSLLGANSAHAQWTAKPAPPLPHSILDQQYTGSVVLGLVFENDGHVKDVRIVRSSGITGLDEVARAGAMNWRMNPASLRAGDTTQGRQHLIKFYQNAKVSRRVEPITAFWREL
ncbi:MAG: energy transducer TonB [Verrucomicrobiota bacterium]|nr:energy transducer TonB [Verrucomicrobiota bacterium]